VKGKTGTVIPQLKKTIRSGITFVSRNVISRILSGVSLLAVSNVNDPVGLVGLPYVMWSAHYFVTHIQTEKISSWNGLTVHVCCFMLAPASTKTFVSQIHIR
jgi:C4-dicarboxylate transporter